MSSQCLLHKPRERYLGARLNVRDGKLLEPRRDGEQRGQGVGPSRPRGSCLSDDGTGERDSD